MHVWVYRDLGGVVVLVIDGCWDGGCGAPTSQPPNPSSITTASHCGGVMGVGVVTVVHQLPTLPLPITTTTHYHHIPEPLPSPLIGGGSGCGAPT